MAHPRRPGSQPLACGLSPRPAGWLEAA